MKKRFIQEKEGSKGDDNNAGGEKRPKLLEKPKVENKVETSIGGSQRQWLAPGGTRHTRVGNDYQVTDLPSPSDSKSDDSGKE
eukprot:CAMPEP_0195304036 /NCGR_PEP_ID=MMETSP0707-20130614/33738_1 /TAXON_ID=33640 /ORGANISM="Asterionellopsis glacialis, Strain CCMP134" /LENGTH=82 /DNA_ID=CAMNT_0040367739 /DNA_START=36 /DNA_END=284 /DNA_ORIENTATION=+